MSDDRTNKNRLLKLADFLSTLPRNRFDFSNWVGKDWGGKPDLSCGTTACALGWATTIPSLRRAGLRLVHDEQVDNQAYVTLNGQVGSWDDPFESSQAAAKEVFGLDYDEFSFLFIPESFSYAGRPSLSEKATPKQVARNIRFFVKHKYGK